MSCCLENHKIFVRRLKGSHSGEHHLLREEGGALRGWLKIRKPFPPDLLIETEAADRPHHASPVDEEIRR
jgi:hypothetical protein